MTCAINEVKTDWCPLHNRSECSTDLKVGFYSRDRPPSFLLVNEKNPMDYESVSLGHQHDGRVITRKLRKSLKTRLQRRHSYLTVRTQSRPTVAFSLCDCTNYFLGNDKGFVMQDFCPGNMNHVLS